MKMPTEILLHPAPLLKEDLTKLETKVSEVKPIADAFVNLCKNSRGAGLAANQVGLRMNACVVSNAPKKRGEFRRFHVLINPKIIEIKGKKKLGLEGCLSLPGRVFRVPRQIQKVKVEYINLKGETERRSFRDIDARVFQHEYDHLKGLTLLETGEECTRAQKSLTP